MARRDRNDPPALLDWFATLSDLARVRIVRLLSEQELSVGELAKALQLPQSTVSRHLKALFEQQWIRKRSEGTASLYRTDLDALHDAAREVWALVQKRLGSHPQFEDDDHRLAQVIAERRTDSKSFFGRIGGEWDDLRTELYGNAFTLEALLALLPSDWTVADLGCGTGNAAELLAPCVKRVIAVDREPAMLDAARKRLASFRNIDFVQGELEALPLKDQSVDAAIMMLVMHHVPAPEAVISEIARVLKSGASGGASGGALIVDMVQHDREAFRHTMGHRHLGFTESAVRSWCKRSGLHLERYRRLSPAVTAKGPGLFAAVLRKG